MRTPDLLKAVDISNWTGPITAEIIAAWRRAGVSRVIVRASLEDYHKREITKQQLGVAKRARLGRQAYLWLYFGALWSPEEQVESALQIIEGFGVSRLWLDCEEASPWDATANIEWIERAVATVGTLPVGIYTRQNWWEPGTGNSQRLGHLPLWDANPDGVMRLTGFLPYGGWATRAVKQVKFDVELGGVTVDLNVYRAGAS